MPSLVNPEPMQETQFVRRGDENVNGQTAVKSWKTNKFESFCILVVDDDPPIVKMVECLLRDMGITSIYKASNGVEALDYFAGGVNVIDLVICDWQMPSMDGLEFLHRLRALRLEIPFVMLTNQKSADDIAAAQNARVSAYVTKPFTAAHFQEKVKKLLTSEIKKKESH